MGSDLVTVGSFADPIQANLARNLLEDAGIKAMLSDETTVSMAWFLTNAVRGVKVQVRAEDADEARAILREISSQSGAVIEEAGEEEPSPEAAPNERERTADRAVQCAVLGLIFFPLELYATWLVLKVFLSDEPLRPAKRRNAIVAGAINVVDVITVGALVRAFGWQWMLI